MNKGDDQIRSQREYFRDLYFSAYHQSQEHTVSTGQAALKSLFFANGGAILALLTILGNSDASYEARALQWSFIWFGMGVIFAIMSQLAMYRLQSKNAEASFEWGRAIEGSTEERDLDHLEAIRKAADAWLRVTLSAALASSIVFLIGAFVGLDAVT